MGLCFVAPLPGWKLYVHFSTGNAIIKLFGSSVVGGFPYVRLPVAGACSSSVYFSLENNPYLLGRGWNRRSPISN